MSADDQQPPVLKAIAGGVTIKSPTPLRVLRQKEAQADNALGLVIDAMGGVLAALSRFPIDLPHRPAEESSRELSAWQRHATMGVPIEGTENTRAVGINERDWSGVVRTVTQHRRDEHEYVEQAIGELREALWACVETVHRALRVDNSSDSVTDLQMQRARKALDRLQTGMIKQEVLGAVSAIQQAIESRREQHREQYATLAGKLDKLGRQLEEARKESTTDPLTAVGNRKLFDIMAPRAIQMATLGRTPLVLVMCDLDKLKLVNDMYGHQSGDAFISGVAKCLSKTFLRQSDVVCRIGGDEFAVVLPNTDLKVARALSERLVEYIGQMPSPHAAMEFQVGASVGLAEYVDGEDIEHWVERADKALYKAKQTAGVRISVG